MTMAAHPTDHLWRPPCPWGRPWYCLGCGSIVRQWTDYCADCERAQVARWDYEGSGGRLIAQPGAAPDVDADPAQTLAETRMRQGRSEKAQRAIEKAAREMKSRPRCVDCGKATSHPGPTLRKRWAEAGRVICLACWRRVKATETQH